MKPREPETLAELLAVEHCAIIAVDARARAIDALPITAPTAPRDSAEARLWRWLTMRGASK